MYQTIQILVINFLLNFEKGWLENEIEDRLLTYNSDYYLEPLRSLNLMVLFQKLPFFLTSLKFLIVHIKP